MKISIIGCGWLGLPLAEYLIDQGYTVKGSTTTPEKLPILEDLGIKPFLIKAKPHLLGEQIYDFFATDVLVINIPTVGKKRNDSAEQYPMQIQEIVSRVVKYNIKYVLFISSTGVYGNASYPITETESPLPTTASGKALIKAERIIKSNTSFHSSILRLAGLVGGERKAGRFLSGRTDLTNANAPVNMVHRMDCIQIIHEIILQNKWGKVYNICASQHPTRALFYTEKAKELGLKPPMFLPDKHGYGKLISNEKVKRDLDYVFKYDDPMEF